MYWIRWQDRIHPSRQQIIAILLLLVIVAALLPIPVFFSLPQNGKDHSEPFPCQDRPCGCRTAAQCKAKCCCFNKEQKLAWAKRNGISAEKVVAATPEVCAPPERMACCSSKRPAKTNQDAQRTVLSKTESKREASSSRCQIVIGVVAQECQGVAQTLAGQSVFVLPPSVVLQPLLEPSGKRFILEGWRFIPRFSEPPVPPPRISLA